MSEYLVWKRCSIAEMSSEVVKSVGFVRQLVAVAFGRELLSESGYRLTQSSSDGHLSDCNAGRRCMGARKKEKRQRKGKGG